MPVKNALTIDVEDYFQVSAFEKSIDRASWDSLEHRVENNVARILESLSIQKVRATFFTLGWLAERYPSMIRDIVGAGHELANHGYGHQRIWDLTPLEFKEDISRAKKILEDIGGVKVNGYRAPSYSIGKRNVWALEVIAETGHTYSSSIYPGSHDQYGFSGAPRFTFRDKNTGLIEVPITTFKLLNRLIPASGGGFFRLYPYAITRTLIQRLNANNHATVFYFHPWEIDPGQPRQQNIGLKARFRHYLNLDRTESRLKRLLNDFSWGRMDEVHVNRENIPEFAID
jgi:polysaccharide deacetylase family protein (PEP-CTERM system associated)